MEGGREREGWREGEREREREREREIMCVCVCKYIDTHIYVFVWYK